MKLRNPKSKMNRFSHLRIHIVLVCLLTLIPVLSARAGILQPGDIVIGEANLDRVIRIDPVTLATNYLGVVDFTDATGGVVVGRNGDIYAMRRKSGGGVEFIRFDGQTGTSNIISTQTLIQTGQRFKVSPDGLSLVVTGETAFGGTRGVFRVNLTNGHQTVITTNLTDDPDYERPWDVAFSPQGHIYVTDWNYGNLLRFNADGTGRHVVCKGGLLQFPAGIDVATDGSIYIASRSYRGIVRVDPDTGAQSSVTTFGFLSFPTDLTVAPDGTLLVAESAADVVVRVDPATGHQTLIYSGTPGPRTPSVFWPNSPILNVQRSGNTVVVTWTTSYSGWQLQTSESPADANSWADSNMNISVNGDQHSVTVQPNLTALYFRLHRR